MKTGIDIVEIRRIHSLVDRYEQRFLDKVFTPDEQFYCDSAPNRYEKYAGRFAAKEAIRKALQPFTDNRYIPFVQIEILANELGVPQPHIRSTASFNQQFQEISLSISHEKHYAVAMAVVQ